MFFLLPEYTVWIFSDKGRLFLLKNKRVVVIWDHPNGDTYVNFHLSIAYVKNQEKLLLLA